MTQPAERVKGPPLRVRFYCWLRGCFALFGLFVFVYMLCFNVDRVISPSMSPTLQGTNATDGDWIVSEKISLWFRSPRRWEVVRFINDEGLIIMKRVAGRPGESVSIDDGGHLLIDGAIVQPPATLNFLHYFAHGPYSTRGRSTTCGDGYFVLGDDSKDSQDSRFDGPIAGGRFNARAWLRVWPPNRFGWVNP